MQEQALKLRLSKLKKASIELKSKVLQDPKTNFEAVSNILASFIPHSYLDKPALPQSNHFNSESSNPPSKATNNSVQVKAANSSNASQGSSLFILPQMAVSSLTNPIDSVALKSIPENAGGSELKSSRAASVYSKDPFDGEIDKMRAQNEELQKRILSIQSQIHDIYKQFQVVQQDSWKKNLPFMQQQSKIGVFITKLFIKEYDFEKIDYEKGQVWITDDRILVEMSKKPIREFKLASILEVRYIGEKALKLDLKVEEIIFIFLEFETQDQKDDWDRTIFVNHKITTSKDLDKGLFIESKEQTSTPHFPPNSKHSKSKSSLKRHEDSQEHTDKTSDKVRKSSMKHSGKGYLQNLSQTSSIKREDSFRNFNQEYTLNGNNYDNIEEMANTPQSFANDNIDRSFGDIVVFGSGGESNNIRGNTSQFNTHELNFESVEQQIQAQQATTAASGQKSQSYIQPSKWPQLINKLKKGYFFVKYSKDGFKPHHKNVSISADEQQLVCVNNPQMTQRKAVPIENIKKIRYPAVDAGISKFVNYPDRYCFCVIEYILNGVDKKMELGCQKSKFTNRFVQELREFLERKGCVVDFDDN